MGTMKKNVVLTRSQAIEILAALEAAHAVIEAADGPEVMVLFDIEESIAFLTDRLFPDLPEGKA